jgi:2-C-methyl-D-erythritol 4-phosphate cytidylyltransferase
MGPSRAALILVAAGPGTRLGAGQPKALVLVAGRSLLCHALDSIERASGVGPVFDPLVIVAPVSRLDEVRTLAALAWPSASVVAGGVHRQESVRAGLDACPEAEIVAVHDAARPFVTAGAISRVFAAAVAEGAAIAALPAVDTAKIADEDGRVQSTPPRERVWMAQTPQAFRRDILVHAHARATGTSSTDDASLVEACGYPVRVVAGDPAARKITTADDLRWAEWMIQSGQWPR